MDNIVFVDERDVGSYLISNYLINNENLIYWSDHNVPEIEVTYCEDLEKYSKILLEAKLIFQRIGYKKESYTTNDIQLLKSFLVKCRQDPVEKRYLEYGYLCPPNIRFIEDRTCLGIDVLYRLQSPHNLVDRWGRKLHQLTTLTPEIWKYLLDGEYSLAPENSISGDSDQYDRCCVIQSFIDDLMEYRHNISDLIICEHNLRHLLIKNFSHKMKELPEIISCVNIKIKKCLDIYSLSDIILHQLRIIATSLSFLAKQSLHFELLYLPPLKSFPGGIGYHDAKNSFNIASEIQKLCI